MANHGPEVFGADPARIKWNIVRGDTSPLRVEFLEDDEETYFDISDWTFEATTYDPQSDFLDSLEVTAGTGYVDILAPASITESYSGTCNDKPIINIDLQCHSGFIGTVNVSCLDTTLNNHRGASPY